MSTIEEMKEEKSRIERLLTDLLRAFEEKHDVEVYSFDLLRTQNMGERSPKLRHVTLEVKV